MEGKSGLGCPGLKREEEWLGITARTGRETCSANEGQITR